MKQFSATGRSAGLIVFAVVHLAVLAAMSISPPALGQSFDEVVAGIREDVGNQIGPEALGASYAAMLSFAVSPEIATAKYYPDTPDGVTRASLRTTRLPFSYDFGAAEGRPFRPFVQFLLAREAFDADFRVGDGEEIDSRWETYGLAIAAGAEVPISDELNLLLASTLGLGRLENEATYRGPLSEAFLQPALQNLLFDWDTKAVLYGVSAALDFNRSWRHFDLEVRSTISHNELRSFDESGELIDFDSGVTTWDAEFNTIHPLPYSVGDLPLSLVVIGGATAFLGENRDALGFSSFFEAGLGLEVDLSSRGWRLESLRLGVKGIYGADVDGWALVLAPRF